MHPSYEESSSEDNLQKPYLSGKRKSAHNGLAGRVPQTMSEGVSWKLLPCAPGWDVDITCARDHVDDPKRPVMSEQSFNQGRTCANPISN